MMEADVVQTGAWVGAFLACALMIGLPSFVGYKIYKRFRGGDQS